MDKKSINNKSFNSKGARRHNARKSASSNTLDPVVVPGSLSVKPLELLCIKDKPTLCTENICRILKTHHSSIAGLRYDEFKGLLEVRLLDHKWEWRPFQDADAVHIQTLISIQFEPFQKVGKDMVYDAMVKVAKDNAYDSAQDYLKHLTWDNAPRLSTWLTATCGTPEDVYHLAVASNWLKGLVKRIVYPGCKFDYVLVLEGSQGIRKSTLLNILGGEWYTETSMSADNKDFFMQFQGKAIIEFSEGETLTRTEVKRLKAIISTQSDKYRPPYGRVSLDFPRRCVFAMTTNQEEYLKDETGNRRWLPVRVVSPQINTEWLQDNRDQLLAEAYHRVVTLKETVHEFPLEETRQQQADRRLTDPNEDVIMDWYATLLPQDKEEGITVDQVAKNALHSGFSGPTTRIEQMSIAGVLRESLNLVQKQVMVNGIRRRRWYPKDALAGMEIKIAKADETF